MQLCFFQACSAKLSAELCRSGPEDTTSLEDALSPSPPFVLAVPFSHDPGHGGNGVNWFGIYLGMVNSRGSLLAVKMELCGQAAARGREGGRASQHRAGPATTVRCSRCSVPSSGKKPGEHLRKAEIKVPNFTGYFMGFRTWQFIFFSREQSHAPGCINTYS